MPEVETSSLVLFNLLAFGVPVGLALLAIGAAEEERAQQVAVTAVLALVAAILGYFMCGFAFQFGGAAFVSGMPGLQSLTAEWSPMDLSWGPGWGVLGLRGLALAGEAYNADVYLLFLSHLPAAAAAVLVALLALSKHVRQVHLFVIGLLISGFIYPLFGNWVWGGGWLANLGLNLQLGHGFVDVAGSGTVFALASLVALSGYLLIKPLRPVETSPARLPPIHFPLFMITGALLALVGWSGLALGNPFAQGRIVPAVVVVNSLFAAAGGALAVAAYSWFVTGAPNTLAAGRGMVAGLVAGSASCAFVPAWASLVIGAIAGALLLAGLYLWEQELRLDDPTGTAATFGLPGIWGLLALGIFADGRWGAGWNEVGAQQYMGISGQGISGLLLASGYQPAEALQLRAQLVGGTALLVVGLVLPWLIFRSVLWLQTAGQSVPSPSQPPDLAPTLEEEEQQAGETTTEVEAVADAADEDRGTEGTENA
jgi:Amt family ammonium transporter